MRKGLSALALAIAAALAIWAGGCAIFEQEKVDNPVSSELKAQIDAAGKLRWDSQRKREYQKIAMRGGLGDGAQVYLVKALWSNLWLDSMKEEVLMTLIINPSFSAAAERSIVRRINGFSMDKSRQRILVAIEVRRAARPGAPRGRVARIFRPATHPTARKAGDFRLPIGHSSG